MATPTGPRIESVTVRDGDMQVTVSATEVSISQVGPRGGRRHPTTFSKIELKRLRGLLDAAAAHQEQFAKGVENG